MIEEPLFDASTRRSTGSSGLLLFGFVIFFVYINTLLSYIRIVNEAI